MPRFTDKLLIRIPCGRGFATMVRQPGECLQTVPAADWFAAGRSASNPQIPVHIACLANPLEGAA